MPKPKPIAQILEVMIADLSATGMDRTAIADATRLSRVTIWRMAIGEARQPDYRTVCRIGDLYEQKVGPSPLRG